MFGDFLLFDPYPCEAADQTCPERYKNKSHFTGWKFAIQQKIYITFRNFDIPSSHLKGTVTDQHLTCYSQEGTVSHLEHSRIHACPPGATNILDMHVYIGIGEWGREERGIRKKITCIERSNALKLAFSATNSWFFASEVSTYKQHTIISNLVLAYKLKQANHITYNLFVEVSISLLSIPCPTLPAFFLLA